MLGGVCGFRQQFDSERKLGGCFSFEGEAGGLEDVDGGGGIGGAATCELNEDEESYEVGETFHFSPLNTSLTLNNSSIEVGEVNRRKMLFCA
jgi:hypothetical protein